MSGCSDFERDARDVRRVLDGDREVFASLVQRHHDRAMRLSHSLLASGAEAEDVVQETVLLAFLNLDRLREPHRFGAWFCSIVANRARDRIRRGGHATLDTERGHESIRSIVDTSPSPEEVRHAREVHDAVLAAIDGLSDVNREAVIGYYMEGYSYRELAELFGVPVSTVKGRLHKGRRQLEPSLAPLAKELFGKKRKEGRMEKTDEVRVVVEDVVRMTPCDERGEEKMRESSRGWPGMASSELALEADAAVMTDPKTGRFFVVYVGIPEGNSIRVSLAGEQTPRPMSHDLMGSIFREVGIEVKRVVVSRLAEKTFYAEILLSQEDHEYRIDSRPSDAIALALRAEAPVYVARSVLDEASHVSRDAWLEWQREEFGLKEKGG